jgi:RNA polymerase sigma-70 factor (ECF subfamily)
MSVRSGGEADEELAALYRRYGFLLRRRCRTLLRDEAAAEDALQDSFIKFIQARDDLRAAENPVAWMYRVVDRCCFDHLRRAKHRRAESLDSDDAPGEHAVSHPGVDLEARDAALRILDELTEPEYQVAVLAYVDGVNQTDIAAMLGLSRPTIWKRLTAVRERATRILGGVP